MIETEINTVDAVATSKSNTLTPTTEPTTPDSRPDKPDAGSSSGGGGTVSWSFLVAQGVALLISTIIVRSFWEFEDASRALAFYGVYHRYGWNQVIHFFGVPGIIWSLMVFLVHVPLPLVGHNDDGVPGDDPKPPTRQPPKTPPLNYAGFLIICYNLFYLSIDPLGAALYAPVLYVMYTSAVALADRERATAKAESAAASTMPWYGTGSALRTALVVHVLCWYLQIHLGHKIIEGAQPAVLQSLGGALSVAPLFAFYEGLWMLGINRELQESTARLVEEYTLRMCSEKGVDAMKACLSI